ncbi:MAG: L-aspartate oxidase [Deltaproteobacteria bacterium]|nr:L-aspartate oxidase [Deltaproteobacteria bacterium]
MEVRPDFLVIGSGIAGLSLALKLSEAGSVALLTKRNISESASYYAQGGIASVWSKEDTFDAHIKDTLDAGAGLCNREVVETVVRDAPARIQELINLGVEFSSRKNNGLVELDLGKEGGHSKRRIVHARDLTGQAVIDALVNAVRSRKNIAVYEDYIAVDLITHSKFISQTRQETSADIVWGAYAFNKKTGDIDTFLAKATFLSTGGAGKVYLYTSNPDTATGDGIAMSFRIGAEIANMEFVQFHPTCLYHSKAKNFLISEAVRGEGAVLVHKDGTRFMHNYHPMAELASRDIVARAIDFELKKSGDECVYLDISHRPAPFIIDRFPNIYNKCLQFGFDMTKEPIPVVPAAHYICGGVRTDSSGLTGIKRLYAIGETACTGLHGANRLASNSLLEALVFADRASRHAMDAVKRNPERAPVIPAWDAGAAIESTEAVVISQNWDELRRLMWNYVGIVRSNKRLDMARRRLDILNDEIAEYYWSFKITSNLLELRNNATIADLIIRCAMMRKESRGLHYNIDYPLTDDIGFKKDTVIKIGATI